VAVPPVARVSAAEQGLLWALAHRPVEGLAAVAQLDAADMTGLVSGPVLELAATLADVPPEVLPSLLRERLSDGERAMFERAAGPDAPPGPAAGCVNALKVMRYARERAAIQREIDRLGESAADADDGQLSVLWARKKELLRRLEELNA
jgi:hypothetical protein